MRVTTNLFSVLDTKMALGRPFGAEDGRGGRQAFAVISYDFWQRAFGSDPKVIGQRVMIDLIPYEVIGVLSRDFWLPFPSDVFAPWPDDELRLQRGRLSHDLGVFGRLKPGVTAAQAESELNSIHARLRTAHPELTGWGVTVVPLQVVTTEYLRPSLLALFGAVTFVLLIACANVANLMLARAIGRSREVAVRAALGASRWHLLRQFLAESLVLGLAAGALGTLLASWGVSLLSAMIPATIPIPDAAAEVTLRSFEIDWRVLVFSLVVSLLTGALFGLAPALHALKVNLVDNLKRGTAGATGGGRRLREALLVGEVALAVVLLGGAGLMLKSFARLQRADLGFRADHLLTLEIELPTDTKYQKRPQQSAFFADVLEQVLSLPGVTSAAVASVLPLHNQEQRADFLIENGPPLPAREHLQSDLRRVSPGYFETMGIRLKGGRLLDDHDGVDPSAPMVGVVDDAFARRFFGEQPALGRRLLLGKTRLEIVGIVSDVRYAGADRDVRPTLYVSFRQNPVARMNVVLRTSVAPSGIVASVKNAVWSLDRDLPVYRVESMETIVADATSAPRLTLSLLGVFAIVALGLAAVGIYGVMAYTVSQRTREIGIRMALGARAVDVLTHILRHGMTVVALGLLVGIVSILALGRVAQSLLYQTSARDPFTLIAIAGLLGAVALLACWLPSRRATKVDPLIALRAE
jgi:putative ABC transport system permease protein